MAPAAKENGGAGSARRKSFNMLTRASLKHLPQINTDVESPVAEDGEKTGKKKMGKRGSIFGLGSTHSSDSQDGALSPMKSDGSVESPKSRPRTLQKGRPSSIFGSLGRRSMTYNDGREDFNASSATPVSPSGSGGSSTNPFSRTVLYSGEIQTTSGMFRKKKEYLVLTESHIIRFKSHARAADVFSSIPNQFGRSHSSRHPSSTSIGSLHEVQSITSHSSVEVESRIPLQQIITIYKVEDGRPYFTLEVVYLDEEVHGAGSLQLILQDPKEADLWHTSIRGAAMKARLLMTEPYPERVIRYLVAAVEAENDYSPLCFHVFRVVRRVSSFKGLRASQDDLQKIGSSVYYLVIGMNLIHLIPLPDFNSSKELALGHRKSRISFGIVSLVKVWVNYDDDRFQFEYRIPTKAAEILELASSGNPDIGYAALNVHHYLKPQWLDAAYNYRGPRPIVNIPNFSVMADQDFGCFDRTLCAYLVAYGCDPSNVQYTVDFETEISPEFRLCKPLNKKKYSDLELLSIFRALRYNESFRSISFRGINLQDLQAGYDYAGFEHMATTTRLGIDVKTYMSIDPTKKSLLYGEIQALILKSYKLEKLDFADCLPRRNPTDSFDETEEEPLGEWDPGCEVITSLMPMGRADLPSVTWLILNGITLGDVDIEYMRASLQKPQSKFRAVEMSRCKLDDRLIMQVITNMERQYGTMECIDISRNPGRIDLESFQSSMTHYTRLRIINLSRTFWTNSDESMFVPKVMLTWRLEQLHLDGISLNTKTLDAIATYLASEASDNLRILHLNQCNLTGSDVAVLMHAMCRKEGEIRDLELHVDSNRLDKGIADVTQAIEVQHAPVKFFMRMIEFEKEDHFRRLLKALRKNATIQELDIAKASLPQDANDDTCDELRLLFHENKTLKYFDISGEQSHLETIRFGVGLTHALTGLIGNTSMQSLRIEYQNLGAQGADALASVIEKNTGLTSIYCDHNEITLQGYTSIVNALSKNYTILELSIMKADGRNAMKRFRLDTGVSEHNHTWTVQRKDDSIKAPAYRQMLNKVGIGAKKVKSDMTPQDFAAVTQILGEKWAFQMERVGKLLDRNRNIKAELPGYHSAAEADAMMEKEHLRPTTAMSDRTMMEQVKTHTTPKVELGDPYEMAGSPVTRVGSRPNTSGNNVQFSPETKANPLVDDRVADIKDRARRLGTVDNQHFFTYDLDKENEDSRLDGTDEEEYRELQTALYHQELRKLQTNREPKNGPTVIRKASSRKRRSEELAARVATFSLESDDEGSQGSRNTNRPTSAGSSNNSGVLPEITLPPGEKTYELNQSEKAIFSALGS